MYLLEELALLGLKNRCVTGAIGKVLAFLVGYEERKDRWIVTFVDVCSSYVLGGIIDWFQGGVRDWFGGTGGKGTNGGSEESDQTHVVGGWRGRPKIVSGWI